MLMWAVRDVYYYEMNYSTSRIFLYYFLPFTCVQKYWEGFSVYKQVVLGDLALVTTWPFFLCILIYQIVQNLQTDLTVHRSHLDIDADQSYTHIKCELFHTFPQILIFTYAFVVDTLNVVEVCVALAVGALTINRVTFYINVHQLVVDCTSKLCNPEVDPNAIIPTTKFEVATVEVEKEKHITTKWNMQLLESSSEEDTSDGDLVDFFFDPVVNSMAGHTYAEKLHRHNEQKQRIFIDNEYVLTGRQANDLRAYTMERRFTADSSTIGMGCSLNSKGVLQVYDKTGNEVAKLTPTYVTGKSHFSFNHPSYQPTPTFREEAANMLTSSFPDSTPDFRMHVLYEHEKLQAKRESMRSILTFKGIPLNFGNQNLGNQQDPDNEFDLFDMNDRDFLYDDMSVGLNDLPFPRQNADFVTVNSTCTFSDSETSTTHFVRGSYTAYNADELVDNINQSDSKYKGPTNFSMPRQLSRVPSLKRDSTQETTWPRLPGFGDMTLDYEDDEFDYNDDDDDRIYE